MNIITKNSLILFLLSLGLVFNLACSGADGTVDFNESGDANANLEDAELDEEMDEEFDEEDEMDEELDEEMDPEAEDPNAEPVDPNAPANDQPADNGNNGGNNNADQGNQASDQQLAAGASLYSSNCSGCHGPLDRSNVKNTTTSRVQRAIDSNAGGMGFLSNLTAEEIGNIVGALSQDGTIR